MADDALAALLGMGFSQQEATRALRFTTGNVEQAATFALDARQQAEARRQQDKELRRKRKRQIGFGQTVGGYYVSLEALERLAGDGLGYPENVAVAALKQVRGVWEIGCHSPGCPLQTDNDVNAAVDLLSNPDTFEQMQQDIVRRSDKGKRRGEAQQVDEAAVRGLQAMGFAAAAAREALREAGGDQMAALESLMAMGEEARAYGEEPAGEAGASGSAGGASGSAGGAFGEAHEPPAEEEVDPELLQELEGMVSRDPLEAYDVDVTEEGRVLDQYLNKIKTEQHQQIV